MSIKIYGLTATDEPLRISMLGRTVFGDVYVSEHSIANILSYACERTASTQSGRALKTTSSACESWKEVRCTSLDAAAVYVCTE